MNGVSHSAIGLATGAMVGMIGLSMGVELAPLALVASSLGAKFPDIDHHATQLGKKRVAMEKATKKLVGVAIGIATVTIVGYTAIEVWKTRDVTKIATPIAFFVLLGILSALFTWLSKTEVFKFCTKHRGIWHTLVMPVILLVGCFLKIESEVLRWILYGFLGGYVSHLVADCLTDRGCPILWPLTSTPVHIPLLSVTTGTVGEKIWMVILIGGQLCLGYCFLRIF